MEASDLVRQKTIGALIIGASIALFFAWGMAFRLFGHAIHLNLPTVGFFAWLLIGMFGLGFAYAGPRGGARVALRFAVMAAIALGVGILRGAYR